MVMDAHLFERIDCPLCGAPEHEPAHTLTERLRYANIDAEHEYQVVRCTGCGLLFVNPRLRREILADVYRHDLYASWEARPGHVPEENLRHDIYHHNLDERLDIYRQFCAKLASLGLSGSVFEVGSGFGYLLKTMQDHGFTVAGVELSRYAADFASRRMGLDDIRCGDFLKEDLGSRRYDLLLLWHVFEHLHQPNETLAKAAAMLKPGGVMLITVPFHETFTADKINPVEHLYYFTKDQVVRFMEKHMRCETWTDGWFVFGRKLGD